MESRRHSVQYKLYPTFKKYEIIYNLSTKKAPPSGARWEERTEKVLAVKNYLAVPQSGPTSISHLLGISKSTAVSIICEIVSASFMSFTDIAISS